MANSCDKTKPARAVERTDLEQFFVERGEKPFRARQLMQWIYQRDVDDFESMTDLSKKLRATIEERSRDSDARKCRRVSMRRMAASNGCSRVASGQAVETVFIPEADRGTLCISSQVGCALDCAFCATGAQGFNRNLSSAEIIGQVRHAIRDLPRRANGDPAVTNVVFMGMGEPLANYRNVVPVLELLISDYVYGLSRRRVTVSTSGIVPHIHKLGTDCNVSLAVSLHAPDDDAARRDCADQQVASDRRAAGCLLELRRQTFQPVYYLRICHASGCE